jgi:hypothetical protein
LELVELDRRDLMVEMELRDHQAVAAWGLLELRRQ